MSINSIGVCPALPCPTLQCGKTGNLTLSCQYVVVKMGCAMGDRKWLWTPLPLPPHVSRGGREPTPQTRDIGYGEMTVADTKLAHVRKFDLWGPERLWWWWGGRGGGGLCETMPEERTGHGTAASHCTATKGSTRQRAILLGWELQREGNGRVVYSTHLEMDGRRVLKKATRAWS